VGLGLAFFDGAVQVDAAEVLARPSYKKNLVLSVTPAVLALNQSASSPVRSAAS